MVDGLPAIRALFGNFSGVRDKTTGTHLGLRKLSLQLEHFLLQVIDGAVGTGVVQQDPVVPLLQFLFLGAKLEELSLQLLQGLVLVFPRLCYTTVKFPGVLQGLLLTFLAFLLQVLVLSLQDLAGLLKGIESLHGLYAVPVSERLLSGGLLLDLLLQYCVRALLLG